MFSTHNFTAILVSCVALAGCGGGGGGSGISQTDVQTLWLSPTGSGAGLVRYTADGAAGVSVVQDVNSATGKRGAEVLQTYSVTTDSLGGSIADVLVRWEDGTTSNLLLRMNPGGGESFLYFSRSNSTGATAVTASGSTVNGLPIGTYNYSGYALNEYVYNGTSYTEEGSFTMSASFSNGTASLVADTDEARYVNNNLNIRSDGVVSGNNGTYIIYNTDGVTELERRSVDFDGTFHGSSATEVTGIGIGGSTTNDDLSIVLIQGQR
jgi:hypothetical protein